MSHNKKTHEQFLEELYNKNEHYRNNKFTVSGTFINIKVKIDLFTDFGECSMMPHTLIEGKCPNIKSAKNMSEYFRNMCIARFGENSNDDLSEINYVNSKTKIKVKDEFGEYWITPSAYLSGRRSKLKAGLKVGAALRCGTQSVISKIREVHPDLIFEIGEYKTKEQHILVKNKYGTCRCSIANLLRGRVPSIKSALNKTEYFVNQLKDVYKDEFDYSLVEYLGSHRKVKIIGPNGIFEKDPHNLLMGNGCPIAGNKRSADYHRKNPVGWTHTNWEAAAKRSKYFTGYKVYFIECWNNVTEERFYKIGRTFIDVKRRFRLKHNMPYQYNILYIIELDDPKRICKLEQYYHRKHKEFKYLPKKEFRGMHECFSKIIYI